MSIFTYSEKICHYPTEYFFYILFLGPLPPVGGGLALLCTQKLKKRNNGHF